MILSQNSQLWRAPSQKRTVRHLGISVIDSAPAASLVNRAIRKIFALISESGSRPLFGAFALPKNPLRATVLREVSQPAVIAIYRLAISEAQRRCPSPGHSSPLPKPALLSP
jgi:hypothetical protein